MFRRVSLPAALRSCLALLFLTVTLPSSAPAAAVNRLKNPGFEQGLSGHPWMPAGWDTSRSGLSSVFFGRDTLLAHGGEYAVTVANVSALWPFSHNWSQSVLVNREDWGKDAVFSIWTRNSGVEGRAYILLQAYRDTLSRLAVEWGVPRDTAAVRMHVVPVADPLYDLGWKRLFFTDEETPWVRREVRVFVPPNTNIIFVRGGLIGTGQLMLDDASLSFEPAAPAPPATPHVNLLQDPGFEQGGLAWEYSLPPYRNIVGRLDSTVAHSGTHSAYFTGGENGWVKGLMGPGQVLANRNLQGKRIRMTGWFKTDSLKSDAFAKLYFHTAHGVEQVTPPEAFGNTTDWSKSTIEADVPRDTYEVWVRYVFNGPAPGRVWFDDCSVEVIGNSEEKPKAGKH